jgi:membrane-associated protein
MSGFLSLLHSAQLLAVGLDPEKLIKNVGVLGALAVIFAESGLLIGFFLPGDSLLFTLGLLRATNPDLVTWPIGLLCLGLFVAAVLGDQVGYQFGRRVGPSLFQRPDSRLFKQSHLHKAQEFFDRYGARTIVLARFVPIVRTFAPVVAGASAMRYKTFAVFNLVGGALWAVGVTLAGYVLGKRFEWLGDKIEILSLVIVGISVAPMAIEFVRHRRRHRAA